MFVFVLNEIFLKKVFIGVGDIKNSIYHTLTVPPHPEVWNRD